jgi:hypothetical protein
MGQTGSPDTIIEGNAPAFRPSHTLCTLAARRTIDDLVQVTHLLQRSTPCPRRALRPFLGRVAKMPRIPLLQPNVARHEHSPKHPLWRPSAERRGKPASVRLPDPPRARALPPLFPRTTPDHLAVIQPPTAARLTACCRLRAVRLRPSRAMAWDQARASLLFRLATAPSNRTL